MHAEYDVVIIGAGMSGLAAGIRLAHFNKRVCILEKHTVAGGLNSFYRRAGRDYDVGLHAVTNFAPDGARNAPLNRVLRQLRLRYEDLELCPQLGSEVRFPYVTLRFNNDACLFESEVARAFPRQMDGFRNLFRFVREFDEFAATASPRWARPVVESFINEPLLVEMLFCPLLYYGSATEHDVDLAQFVIMFRSIFLEGLARPRIGVRRILAALLRKYRGDGGELRFGASVKSLNVLDKRVTSITLENGTEITAGTILSSAGLVETMKLCSDVTDPDRETLDRQAGRMSFVELICVLDALPKALGCNQTIIFFNNSTRFRYRRPEELIDPGSGVICFPANFHYDRPLEEGVVRITNMANADLWLRLNGAEYETAKRKCQTRSITEAEKFSCGFRDHIVCTDMFTPRTIERFTSHVNGAVYGAPGKIHDGRTRLSNLFLCGNDQGYLGIVGTMLSGILMANEHVLKRN
jgi:phytoene dehydrogenase-like protein